ncbi:peptidoglycan-binding domain-containing protein [uncultured Clostridium sp.]
MGSLYHHIYFQRDHGLTPDGIAGPKTIQILRQKTDGLI